MTLNEVTYSPFLKQLRHEAEAYGFYRAAKDAGCSAKTLYRILDEESVPNVKLVLKLCEVLGIKVTIDRGVSDFLA